VAVPFVRDLIAHARTITAAFPEANHLAGGQGFPTLAVSIYSCHSLVRLVKSSLHRFVIFSQVNSSWR
jgi:hypothetical protein